MSRVPTAIASRRSHRGTLLLLAGPVLAFYVVALVLPVGDLFERSLDVPGESGRSLENFRGFFGDEFYREGLITTVRLAGFATAILLVLAFPIAYFLYSSESQRARNVVVLMILSPLMVSGVARVQGWSLIFTPGTGLAARIPGLRHLDLYLTETAVLIGFVHFFLPFMVLSIYSALTRIDRSTVLAARSLGAGRYRLARDVIVPLAAPGALVGATITFAMAGTAVSTPVLLGGTSVRTMGSFLYRAYLVFRDYELGSAISVILLAMTTVVVVGLGRLITRRTAHVSGASQ